MQNRNRANTGNSGMQLRDYDIDFITRCRFVCLEMSDLALLLRLGQVVRASQSVRASSTPS